MVDEVEGDRGRAVAGGVADDPSQEEDASKIATAALLSYVRTPSWIQALFAVAGAGSGFS